MMHAAVLFSCYIISSVQCHSVQTPHTSSGCPLWMSANESRESELGNTVKCVQDQEGTFHLSLLPCYCITQYGSSPSAVVGLCQHTCSEELPLLHYISLPARINVSELTHVVCKNFSRRGQMCGECGTGHALAAYSYTSNCVNCIHSTS